MYLVSDKPVKWRSPTGKVFSSETCRTMVVRSYRANCAIDQWCLTARITSNHMRKMRGSVLRPKASVSKCAKQGTASANHCHNTLFECFGVFGIYPNQERASMLPSRNEMSHVLHGSPQAPSLYVYRKSTLCAGFCGWVLLVRNSCFVLSSQLDDASWSVTGMLICECVSPACQLALVAMTLRTLA
jgi:hypothetical protein